MTFFKRLAALVAVACALMAGPAAAADILIRNVNVVTLDQRGTLAEAAVLVRDGKIAAVLAKGEAQPSGAEVRDGGGAWLMPGLIDAHMHYQAEHELAGYLSYGVTTALSLGSREQEYPGLIEARRKLAAGQIVGPRLYATGRTIANHEILNTPEEVGPYMDRLQAAGLEFVKVYNNIPQPVFDAVVRESKTRGLGVFGHMPRGFAPEYTLSHGLDVLAHMEELFFTTFGGPRDQQLGELAPDWQPDLTRIDPILDQFVANDVAIIPNLVTSTVYQNLWRDEEEAFSSPDFANLEPEVAEGWRKFNYSRRNTIERRIWREQIKYPLIRVLAYRAAKKGVLLLAGSDAPIPGLYVGRSLHQELRLLVAAGLTNEEALKTATVNGGIMVKRHVDKDACIGVIQVGCEADLVLVEGDPLADIRNTQKIKAVMADGRWFTRDALNAMARPKAP